MTEFYIGLMSGTSADGIDAALVDFSQPQPRVVATHYAAYSSALREKILALCQQGSNEIERMGELDVILGKEFALAANALLKQQSLTPADIKAIGSHGQTIRHLPHPPHGFTLQIGDPNTIAAHTGITTVADFRRKDIALGGQGAPLVPAFHQHIFSSNQTNRAIVNIGGIANVTVLSCAEADAIIGFDTGPGNVLLDAWINTHQQLRHDENGAWGSKGKIHSTLLERLLADSYFELAPPKSTGREHFNLRWLQQHLETLSQTLTPVDVQATLIELTAHTIISAIQPYFSKGEILICGGGVHNAFLMQRLNKLATPYFSVDTTQKYGVDPDWMEAIAFAWLAQQTLHRKPGNLLRVTGAKSATVLGGVYF